MANNVHSLPTQPARGRRQVRPLPHAPLADVIRFKIPSAPAELTPEQKIAELNRAIDSIVRSVLDAIHTVQRLDGRDSRYR